MLVVKVELWPFGFEGDRRELGRLDIWNKGWQAPAGHYGYRLYKDGEPTKVIRQGTVKGFNRETSTAYDLLQQVLEEATAEPYESGWLEKQHGR